MNRLISAVCLSTSLVAIVVAIVIAIYVPRAGDGLPECPLAAELERVALVVESLNERIDKLESQAIAVPVRAPDSPSTQSVEVSSEPPGIGDQIATLQARMTALEDAETIARLAQAGATQIRRETAQTLLADLLDPAASPQTREERLYAYWDQHGEIGDLLEESGLQDRDAVLPLLSLAEDENLDVDTRVKVLSEISQSRIEELRGPLLDLLSHDESPRIRQQAVRNLTAHAHDIDVQNAILSASREDVDERVRGTAQRRLEPVLDIAQETTPGSPITQLTQAELWPESDYDEGEESDEGEDKGEHDEEPQEDRDRR